MKFMHLSDLHLGKRVNEFSMLEDQEYILKQILEIADEHSPQAVIIAGDVYDKPVPPVEAVTLFDSFLERLSARNLRVFVISGNHDSAERVAFGTALFSKSGVYFSPPYSGAVEPITLSDEHGEIDVFMLPFIKPIHVRRFFPESEIASYTDAIAKAIDEMPIRKDRRSVLITHQFVTGATQCDSEELSVGGSDNVDADVFDAFDYVALGHIHSPQSMRGGRIRYCGTPLKYSFSEAKHKKSVTLFELCEKGIPQLETVPLKPLHDMVEIRGSYDEVTDGAFRQSLIREDYYHITLTDEDDIPDAILKLRTLYPNLMRLDYDNSRTRSGVELSGAEEVERRSPIELFAELFEKQNNREMSEEQLEYVGKMIEQIWEDER